MPRLQRPATRERRSSAIRLPRLFFSIMGPEGNGKTNMMLTAQRPMAVFGVDPNTVDVIEKVFKTDIGDIDPEILTYTKIPFPAVGFNDDEDEIMREGTESWAILVDGIRQILKGKVEAKSVLLDTGTELNDLNILAGFGKTSKIAPAQRKFFMGDVNARFKGIFRALENANVHVIVTHRCKNVWATEIIKHGPKKGEEVDRMVPGEYERIGFKQMGNMCNAEVLAMFDPEREGKLVDRFGVRITRCTIRPALIRKEYWGKTEDGALHTASIPYLATQMYPQTTVEDWE